MSTTTLRTTMASTDTSKVMKVTPEMAQYWLSFNTSNRTVSKHVVARLADDILHGRWVYNGDSIKFDREGRLLDGQHRLNAVILSGLTVDMLVVSGLQPAAQQTIDVGRPRTAGDILQMNGVANGKDHASVAAALIRMERHPGSIWNNHNMPSKTEIVEYGMSNMHLICEAVTVGRQAYSSVGIVKAAYGVLYASVVRSSCSDLWDTWHERLISGSNLDAGDPRLTLRNQSGRRAVSSSIWGQQMMAGWCLVAFKAWTEGRNLKIIRFTRDQLPMPTID